MNSKKVQCSTANQRLATMLSESLVRMQLTHELPQIHEISFNTTLNMSKNGLYTLGPNRYIGPLILSAYIGMSTTICIRESSCRYCVNIFSLQWLVSFPHIRNSTTLQYFNHHMAPVGFVTRPNYNIAADIRSINRITRSGVKRCFLGKLLTSL